jgi:hypothetical protein
MTIPLDTECGVATLPWGTELRLQPFFGAMGVAPPRALGGDHLDHPEATWRQSKNVNTQNTFFVWGARLGSIKNLCGCGVMPRRVQPSYRRSAHINGFDPFNLPPFGRNMPTPGSCRSIGWDRSGVLLPDTIAFRTMDP